MSANSPDSDLPSSRGTSEPSLSATDEAVKTFAFEVTAGRVAHAEDASLPLLAGQPRNARQQETVSDSGASEISTSASFLPVEPTHARSPDRVETAPMVSEDPSKQRRQSPSPSSATKRAPPTESTCPKTDIPLNPLATSRQEKQQPRAVVELAEDGAKNLALPQKAPVAFHPQQRVRRQASWWITSLGVHIIGLFILACSTLAVIQEEKLELYASPVIQESFEEFEDLDVAATELPEVQQEDLVDDSLPDELAADEPDMMAELTSEPLLDSPALGESLPTLPTSSLEEISQLFGDSAEDGSGITDLDVSSSGTAMAKFFGTEVKARRILYLLDNSGGMRKGGKFEALVAELQASVSTLSQKQKFYVIFYSDTVYPLFYPPGVRQFIAANDRNRQRLEQWLSSVELCGGNAIDEALAAADVVRPEVVFLLTDGDLFTTEKKKDLLLNHPGRPYQIHTFGLGVGPQTRTAAELQQVAAANGGSFRSIKVSDSMKETAKAKQRPYHNKTPGAVWGLKVGKR